MINHTNKPINCFIHIYETQDLLQQIYIKRVCICLKYTLCPPGYPMKTLVYIRLNRVCNTLCSLYRTPLPANSTLFFCCKLLKITKKSKAKIFCIFIVYYWEVTITHRRERVPLILSVETLVHSKCTLT